jgi:hypothetical protein
LKDEIFENNILEIEGPFTTPKTITQGLNLEITTKLVQITNPDSMKVNTRIKNGMK